MKTSNRIKLEILITEREAMVAGNAQRITEGSSVSYTDIDFFRLAQEMKQLLENTDGTHSTKN